MIAELMAVLRAGGLRARVVPGNQVDYLRPCSTCGRFVALRVSNLCEWCLISIRPWPGGITPLPITPTIPADPRPGTPESHKAYRAGRCSRCLTAPYAPGRALCDPCWRTRAIAGPRPAERTQAPNPSTERS